jgi:large repetitive protein
VAQASAIGPQTSAVALPAVPVPVLADAPSVAGSNTIDVASAGHTLYGSAGSDNFVFEPGVLVITPTPMPLTHIAGYSAAQGDTFDFSALTSAFHGSNANDASVVRAVEDPGGTFATLQVNSNGPSSSASWVSVAQLDGAHPGDPVNVLVDNHAAAHFAQIHVDLLV